MPNIKYQQWLSRIGENLLMNKSRTLKIKIKIYQYFKTAIIKILKRKMILLSNKSNRFRNSIKFSKSHFMI